MHITIESVGGFAGTSVPVADYDTADLPKDRADRIREAVARLAAAEDAGRDLGEIGADLPGYRVTTREPGAPERAFEIRGEPHETLVSPLDTLLNPRG
ncbi:protealysin inhibitor emfourin [Actinomadura gamaensis]|uniref:Protealysin inhibitor emfourin n=1 Tax=Actinomadura gamaensis TaxID=1763541 RepID=A0ABV9U2U7_9ACTN